MVTLLGFGIVLLLLFFLIFVMMGFGWVMQRINAPAAPKAAPAAAPAPAPAKAEAKAEVKAEDADLAAVAYCLSLASDDKAAVAYALYLYNHAQEFPTPVMPLQSRNTAWNSKAYNMNNLGF